MSIEALRHFYARAKRVLPLANNLRLAETEDKPTEDSKAAAAALLAATDSWVHEMDTHEKYIQQVNEWRIVNALWVHGDVEGIQPAPPRCPADIPQSRAVFALFEVVSQLRDQSSDHVQKSCIYRGMYHLVIDLIDGLNEIKKVIHEYEQGDSASSINQNQRKQPAEPITIKQMALLGGIPESTVSSWGTDGRPAPRIEHRGKRPAIYCYAELRLWFQGKQPDRADCWPESFSDAKNLLDQLSSSGNARKQQR